MGVLTNCTIDSVIITVAGSTALTDTEAATQVLTITPNEGYVISGSNVTTGTLPTGVSSIQRSDTSTPGQVGNKVSITVDIDNTHTVTANSVINLDITASAVAIVNYGLVRPAIIENVSQALNNTTAVFTSTSLSAITEVSNVGNVDTHYFNSEVPLDTWVKIGTLTVSATSSYTIVYPPYLVSNGSEIGLSKFDLIQTAITESATTGIISQYVFDLMFKDTGTTGFNWPLDWSSTAVTDPEMSAVLSVKTNLVTVPAYDYEINTGELGGGIEYAESSSDIVPSGGLQPMDVVYTGDPGSTFEVSAEQVGVGDQTDDIVGSTNVFTIGSSGFTNIPLTLAPNEATPVKYIDVIISGTGTTAILSQVNKTSDGANPVAYTGANTSSVTNRYKQLGNADASINITSSGFNAQVSNTHVTKTVKPLLPTSGRQVGFLIVRNGSGSTNTARITGDIFYEKMGYESKNFDIDFEDWFDYDNSGKVFTVKSTLPSGVLNTTNTIGAVVTIKNIVPTVVSD